MQDITEEDLENIAITVRDKVYDKVLVSGIFRKVCITGTLQHTSIGNLTLHLLCCPPEACSELCGQGSTVPGEKAGHLA